MILFQSLNCSKGMVSANNHTCGIDKIFIFQQMANIQNNVFDAFFHMKTKERACLLEFQF